MSPSYRGGPPDTSIGRVEFVSASWGRPSWGAPTPGEADLGRSGSHPLEYRAMTFVAFLNETQKRIWTEERAVLQHALDVLTGWEAAPADVEHLRRAPAAAR